MKVSIQTRRKKQKSAEDRIMDTICYGICILLMVSILLPFMQVLTISVSPPSVVNANGFHLIPKLFDFSGYTEIAKNNDFWHSYVVTILRTLVGTLASVFFTMLTAYPLAKANLPYRRGIMIFIVFTMYFSGGMIPTYLLIRNLKLYNNFLVYILPNLMTGFALIITRNFFMGVPSALEESAKIDGASNWQVLFKIYLPLSKPVMATIVLWYAVDNWNAWIDNMLYVSDRKLYVLQYVLQTILKNGRTAEAAMTEGLFVNTETMKMAALVLTLIPIVCTYPYLQKYFVKGMVLGSVKE